MNETIELGKLSAWVDGGARGNPGPAGWGVLIMDGTGRPIRRCWGYCEEATNNVAEYQGLLLALEQVLELGARGVDVYTDSELLQRQVTGTYKVRQPHLKRLFAKVCELAGRLEEFRIHHVRREQNREADRLANRAMDERRSGVEG